MKSGANVQFFNFLRYVPICVLFSGFGVYIVTESVMGLWWFQWIVYIFSCIGLATSFTSSKSYCIKSFLFSYQIVLFWILQIFYQITSKSFLFASDSTHEYGDKMPTHETACCITIAFLGNKKNCTCWYVVWDYP